MSGKNNKAYLLFVVLAVALMLQSCREDEVVVPTEYDLIPEHAVNGQGVQGMYLLNEGNMGSNK
ncbi:MAG: YncE family protein, partial [Bacteroidaceae bacterium]